MTDLDRNRKDVRDEAQAGEYQEQARGQDAEGHDPRSDTAYQGDPAFQDDPARQGDPAYQGDPARRGDPAYQGDTAFQGDPARIRGDDAVLTRDPEAGYLGVTEAGTGTAGTQDRGVDAGVRPGPNASDMQLVDNPDKLMLRWQEVQVAFVDDPREALRTADALVQQVMKQVEDQFSSERSAMEQQWSRGEDVSTEDMRLVLQRYRTF